MNRTVTSRQTWKMCNSSFQKSRRVDTW